MNLKEIKLWPLEVFSEKTEVRWKVTVREPIQEGTRLLVVDFLKNEGCTAYKRECASFRIVCSKKKKEVKGIAGGKITEGAIESLARYAGDRILISEKEEKRLASFFGQKMTEGTKKHTNNHYLDSLREWAVKTQRERKERARQERGELMEEDYQLCPEEIPRELITFIRREVLPRDKVLLYKRGNVRGLCYCCGAHVRADRQRFRQSETVTCPNCGASVICVLEDSNRFAADFVESVVIAQKGTDGETVFFRQFSLLRDPEAEWESIEGFLRETVRYGIRGEKTAKWQKEYKEVYYMYMERYRLDRWIQWQGNRIYDNGYLFCTAGVAEALAGTPMQYADLAGYLQNGTGWKDPIHFLEYHAQNPVVEFLWKNGYHRLVRQRINGMSKENRNAILWKRKKLKDCFRFPLRILKLFPPEEWDLDMVGIAGELWQKNRSLSEGELRAGIRLGKGVHMIEPALDYAPITKVVNYLEKQWQKGKGENTFDTFHYTVQVYRDYLGECQHLHLSLGDKQVLFPPNLITAHERTMAQITFERNKADQEKFRKAVEAAEKYAWEKKDFFIRPAGEQKELADEGAALHHCVGGYIKRMANQDCIIFFVRKTEEPNQPYFTLELDPKTKGVIQCRTEHNRSYESFPEVKAFIEEWVKKIVAKGGKKKNSKEAAA